MNVYVVNHARDRAAERGVTVEIIEREIDAAMTAGRMAKRKPTWTYQEDEDASRGGRAKAGTWRYFWNADETRAYLAVRGGGEWRVVTVLLRTEVPA